MSADAGAPGPDWAPRFFTLWTGQALSLLGSQLVQFALIWHLTATTDSASALAGAALAGLLPQVLLSPVIGTLVDRWDRRRLLLAADIAVALTTLGLIAAFATGTVQLWHLYLALCLRAVGGGFHQSAMGASLVLLVPREHLARVQGLNQSLTGGLNLLSAPLGAALLAVLPMAGVLAVDVVTALAAVVPLLFIALPRPRRRAAPASWWADLRAGWHYVLSWPALVIILSMVTLINFLLTPVSSLLPLLVTRHFAGDALQLGVLQAVFSGGVVAGGLGLGAWGGFRRRVITALCGLVGLGLGIVLTGSAPAEAFWMALAAQALTGLMMPITNGSFGAVLQASIAPEMQGRVFALILSAATAMAPLGLVIAGPVSDVIGVRAWFWLAGLTCAGMGLLGFGLPVVLGFEARPREAA